jgi:hypothetical protein
MKHLNKEAENMSTGSDRVRLIDDFIQLFST